jgi:general stress protein 26
MVTYLPLFFLQEKINELQTSLFYNLSTSVLKTPNSVVKALTTDDAGQIWFCMPVYGKFVNEFDKEFPSLLQFFKKGKNFHVRINGKAFIVNDPEEVNSISWADQSIKDDAIAGRLMLIKVKIEYADYFERKQKARQTKTELTALLKNIYVTIFDAGEPKYSFLHSIRHKSNSFPGRIQYQ